MLRRFTTRDYEKMATSLAKSYAADTSQDLEGLVVKHASAEGMLPEQVRNLVHSMNNMAFLELFNRDKEAGNEPLGEFPVVDPESAIAKTEAGPEVPGGSECGGSCEQCVLSEDSCGNGADYDPISDLHGEFPDMLGEGVPEGGANIKITIEKVAAEECSGCPECPHPSGTCEETGKSCTECEKNPEKVAALDPRVRRDNLIRSERIRDAVRERKYATAFEVQENIEKLATDLRLVGAPSLERTRMLVEAYGRPLVKQAFSMVLRQMDRDPEKIAAQRTPRAYSPSEAPLPDLIKIAGGLHRIRVINAAEKKVEAYADALSR